MKKKNETISHARFTIRWQKFWAYSTGPGWMHLKSGLPGAVNLGLLAVYVYSCNDGLTRIIGPTLIIYYETQWALCCRIGLALLLYEFSFNFFFYEHNSLELFTTKHLRSGLKRIMNTVTESIYFLGNARGFWENYY